MEALYSTALPLVIGFLLDQIFGDPQKMPHLIVGFGKTIAFLEKRFNRGKKLIFKGAVVGVALVLFVFGLSFFLLRWVEEHNLILAIILKSILVFYSLSALTLRREVRNVFKAVDRSVEDGRVQLQRIVGRDTATLSPQKIRTSALETLSENLSDGVIAPLFWYALLGVPGMLAYKMTNTLDSMIGYKNERYIYFGRFSARLDDVLNYIPARLTALLMLIVSGSLTKIALVWNHGKRHTSPNSGYPEAALAFIIGCRFGGPNSYFGQMMDKPFIGCIDKLLDRDDLRVSIKINFLTEWLMFFIVSVCLLVLHHLCSNFLF
ncbi:MAG: cobalamin biosynthesis protein CobD [Breznakibacter sp.]|nr:cobalamin biosynthesis protein CobD [Breznakibacter sp.]